MNDVSILGRFVKPVVVKDLGENRCVINNVLAITRKYKSEGKPSADFIPVVIWGKTARIVEKFCQKGNLVGVTGQLSSRKYATDDGKNNFVVEIIVKDIHLVEGKRYLD